MAAAVMRWWQMIHNGGTPTAIAPSPGPSGDALIDTDSGAFLIDTDSGAFLVDS